MYTLAYFFLLRGKETPSTILLMVTIFLAMTAYLLWQRYFKHKWLQSRAEGWVSVQGKFVPGESEVVPMKRGRSDEIAEYEAWLYYEYSQEGQQDGIYTRAFPSKSEANDFLKLLEGKPITVKVNPRRPQKSQVLDSDINHLLGKS